jgi:hypothetical protein
LKAEYLNNLSKEIHSRNVAVGWWSEGECIFQKIQLIITECAEMTEGARKNLMDDKLPHYKMEIVECADIMIRALDIGGRLELTYEPTGMVHPFIAKGHTAGMNHLGVSESITGFAKACYSFPDDKGKLNLLYSMMIDSILDCATAQGFNFAKAMQEKLTFNSSRPDHKLENRAKEKGKKF